MPYYPDSYIAIPFSGIKSGFVIHPYHMDRLYYEVSGIEQILGFNPLNGYPSLTERISGIESGYWNLSQESVLSPLFIVNSNGVSVLSGQYATALQNGFLNAVDWTSFNSRVFRAGDTMTGGLTVLGQLTGLRLWDSGIRPVGFITNGGFGSSLISSKSDNVYRLMGLSGVSGIQIITNGNDLQISVTGVTGGSTFTGGLITLDITPTNSGTLAMGTQTSPFATGYFEQYATTRFSGQITSSIYTLDWNNGSSQAIGFVNGFVTGVTLTLQNGIPGSSYVLEVYNNASGTATINWGTNTKWQNRSSGVPTNSGSAMDLFNFYYNGNSYLSSAGFNYV